MQLNVVWQLAPVTGKVSQVSFPYKVVINNYNVTIEANPILLNCSQGFTQNFGLSKYWMQKIQKSWNKNVPEVLNVHANETKKKSTFLEGFFLNQ